MFRLPTSISVQFLLKLSCCKFIIAFIWQYPPPPLIWYLMVDRFTSTANLLAAIIFPYHCVLYNVRSCTLCHLEPRGLFLKSSVNFWGPKSCSVCLVYSKDQSFDNNNAMKLSVNELCARNFATIQQVLILELTFRPKKFPGLLRSQVGPRLDSHAFHEINPL